MTHNNHITVQLFSHVNIAFVDRVVQHLVDPTALKTQHGGVEQRLGPAEAFIADGDNLLSR